MKRIRIVVDAMPRMLRDIIEGAVNLQSDMQLIDTSDDPDLSTTIKSCAADVVILAERTPPGVSSHHQILIENPQLKIFVVTDGGREAHLLEFRGIPVVQVSPQGLVDAIRATVAMGRGTRVGGG